MTYVDLDDFFEGHTRWNLLYRLKQEIPQFKVTLFTIPARCSLEFVREVQKHDWISLVAHGWRHPNCHECRRWTERETRSYLRMLTPFGFDRGFKAPGWQINGSVYQALKKADYWAADQEYNNSRRPEGLNTYLLDSPNKIHGHIGHLGGQNLNELEFIVPAILNRREDEFGFVKEAVQ